MILIYGNCVLQFQINLKTATLQQLPSEHKILVQLPIDPSSPHKHVLQLSYGEGTRDPARQPR